MLVEIIQRALYLDAGYFIGLVAGAPFWVFAFVAAGYFFGNGQKVLLNFMVITGLLLGFADLLRAHDLVFYTAPALMVLYFARLSVLTALEKTKDWQKHVPLAFSLTTYAVLFYYNFFML